MTTTLTTTDDLAAADSYAEGAALESGELGVIGTRQLIAVQTFEIARLTSHPVALRPSCFVAVTGRGPTDSNESGKTSFNAAVSLLLGDPEWRVTGGGLSSVGQLLFEPDTAGVAAARYAAAQHGYIVGVFADEADPAGSVHTVWLRLAPSAPYLQIRHAPGLHLVPGADDTERHKGANVTWASLPTVGTLGPRTYTEVLYGRSPRCLAYVATRGKQRSGPSLLKMDAGAFTPEAIGAALVRQTGRAEALEREQEQRRKAAALTEQLAEHRRESERLQNTEERTLIEVNQRVKARTHLAEGQQLWRAHFARGLLDNLARSEHLTTQLAADNSERELRSTDVATAKAALEAFRDDAGLLERVRLAKAQLDEVEQQLSTAVGTEGEVKGTIEANRGRLRDLEALGARDARLDVTAAAAAVKEAEQQLLDARLAVSKLEDAERAVGTDLEAARAGGTGRAGQISSALTAAGIDAYPLLDDVALDEEHRSTWQARLEPWQHAVVVNSRAADAIAALAADPAYAGAVLIDAEQLPAGASLPGVTAQPGTIRFLHALAEHAPLVPQSAHPVPAGTAFIELLSVTLVGGHAEQTTGLAHRIASLEARLVELAGELDRARRVEQAAQQQLELAQSELRQAQAAAEYTQLGSAVERLEREDLTAVQALVVTLAQARDAANTTFLQLFGQSTSLEAQRDRLAAELRSAEQELTQANLTHKRTADELGGLRLDYWLARFAGSESEAKTILGWPDVPLQCDASGQLRPPTNPDGSAVEHRNQRTLANVANGKLDHVLLTLDIDERTGDRAPTTQIRAAVEERARTGQDASDPSERSFDVLSGPLEEWLEQLRDRDEQAQEAIAELRVERDRQEAYTGSQLGTLQAGLSNIQDALQARIEDSLRGISDALHRLDLEAGGFGADLTWEIDRPAGANDTWVWKVTPRWRRSAAGRMLAYDYQTNSAQEKLFSVHLVLAALLASPHPRGRVLILDELGDSLGEDHRRRVLSAIKNVAERYGVTVLGTCQDAVMPDAASFCGEVLFFHYPSKAEALNAPTRVFGFDANAQRVELTEEIIRGSRPYALLEL